MPASLIITLSIVLAVAVLAGAMLLLVRG
ncbi:MAG: hypothetical protein K0Q80_2240, partial [Microvirga sp.]|nr:hypothetical protein [Microvirga sp.]